MVGTYKKLTDYIPLMESDQFGKWIVDTKNDGTAEHPYQFPFVSYSEMINKLTKEIYAFDEEHPEYGLNKYGQILEEHNIEWGTQSMIDADTSEADGRTVMALLLGAVRAERFCDGAWLSFLQKGAVVRWLKRLETIDNEL